VAVLHTLGVTLALAASPYDSVTNTWTLTNDSISASFQLTGEGQFRFLGLSNPVNGDQWQGAGSAPFRFQMEDRVVDATGPYRLISQSLSEVERGASRQTIVLEHQTIPARVRLEFELYPGQPVLRYRSRLENRSSRAVWITEARIVDWRLADAGRTYRTFRVNQWVKSGKDGNFEPLDVALGADGAPAESYSGAHGQHCAWLVVRDGSNRGLFFGWEFDGRARVAARHARADGVLEISGGPELLFHPLQPGEEFLTPGAFVGVFRGDWDEASFRTHRFAEAALARQVPDPEKFPYVIWDSWGYDQYLDERTLRRAARVAARLGIEVFVLDLGWARAIGDWRADPAKFPSGLRALSDYVHSLGMKFGLHFAFAEASPAAPALREHPDWFASAYTNYYGARSLCLAHRPVREWIVAEGLRMIREYNVDWILQDGENMVKHCTRAGHTHDPENSNYANAVALNAVLDAIHQAAPHVLWENCEDGGNLMTFSMVQRYVTSIAADDTGPLTTRQAAYGATFPFPPRYTDRYMPGDDLNDYITRSYMFGGPWIFMNKIAAWTERQIDFAAREIALYKRLRPLFRDGRVYHLRLRPADQRTDAMQAVDPATGGAVVFVYREQTPASQPLIRPRGLAPNQLYRVRFQDHPEQLLETGATLARDGIRVVFANPRDAEIIYIDPEP
jgi:hypothetical protein